MDAKTIIAIGQVAEAIANIGLPAVKKIVDNFNESGDPNMEDIMSVDSVMKQPEEYFEDIE